MTTWQIPRVPQRPKKAGPTAGPWPAEPNPGAPGACDSHESPPIWAVSKIYGSRITYRDCMSLIRSPSYHILSYHILWMGESLKCNFSPRKKDYSRREYTTRKAEMSALFSGHKKKVKKKKNQNRHGYWFIELRCLTSYLNLLVITKRFSFPWYHMIFPQYLSPSQLSIPGRKKIIPRSKQEDPFWASQASWGNPPGGRAFF